jgi:2-iminobutanoate/2-iminopropanoate deaminase
MVTAMTSTHDDITPVSTPDAPAPAGHYAQGVVFGDLVFVSGQLATRPDGTKAVHEPFEVQVRVALENTFAILRAAGSGRERVLKVTAYIVGVENWPAFNRAYADVFGDVRPARSVVPVPELHHGYLVEIEVVAAKLRSGTATPDR